MLFENSVTVKSLLRMNWVAQLGLTRGINNLLIMRTTDKDFSGLN